MSVAGVVLPAILWKIWQPLPGYETATRITLSALMLSFLALSICWAMYWRRYRAELRRAAADAGGGAGE